MDKHITTPITEEITAEHQSQKKLLQIFILEIMYT